jgi:hypothetical protein
MKPAERIEFDRYFWGGFMATAAAPMLIFYALNRKERREIKGKVEGDAILLNSSEDLARRPLETDLSDGCAI